MQSDFWDDPQQAEIILKGIKSKKSWTGSFEKAKQAYDDLETLYEFYQAGDVEEAEINQEFQAAVELLEDLELKKMLNGEEEQFSLFFSSTSSRSTTAA